jgi:hypothetical protein
MVASFSSEVVVEGILSAELAGSMLFAEFAEIAGGWLWCHGTIEVVLGCLDRLMGKWRIRILSEVGLMPIPFLLMKDVNGIL